MRFNSYEPVPSPVPLHFHGLGDRAALFKLGRDIITQDLFPTGDQEVGATVAAFYGVRPLGKIQRRSARRAFCRDNETIHCKLRISGLFVLSMFYTSRFYSETFSPQLRQNFVPGGSLVSQCLQRSSADRSSPHEGQNLSAAPRSFEHLGHFLITTI